MKAEKSNLELVRFAVLESSMLFVQSEQQAQHGATYLDYDIDLDFSKSVQEQSAREFVFIILLNARINFSDTPVPGYKIRVNTAAVFKIAAPDTLDKKERTNLENISALSIAIGALRNHLMAITSFGPIGSYTLPAIKVGDLIKEKARQSESKGNITAP